MGGVGVSNNKGGGWDRLCIELYVMVIELQQVQTNHRQEKSRCSRHHFRMRQMFSLFLRWFWQQSTCDISLTSWVRLDRLSLGLGQRKQGRYSCRIGSVSRLQSQAGWLGMVQKMERMRVRQCQGGEFEELLVVLRKSKALSFFTSALFLLLNLPISLQSSLSSSSTGLLRAWIMLCLFSQQRLGGDQQEFVWDWAQCWQRAWMQLVQQAWIVYSVQLGYCTKNSSLYESYEGQSQLCCWCCWCCRCCCCCCCIKKVGTYYCYYLYLWTSISSSRSSLGIQILQSKQTLPLRSKLTMDPQQLQVCVKVVAEPTTMSPLLALVMLTLTLVGSLQNPILPYALDLTSEIKTQSFSPPWQPSQVLMVSPHSLTSWAIYFWKSLSCSTQGVMIPTFLSYAGGIWCRYFLMMQTQWQLTQVFFGPWWVYSTSSRQGQGQLTKRMGWLQKGGKLLNRSKTAMPSTIWFQQKSWLAKHEIQGCIRYWRSSIVKYYGFFCAYSTKSVFLSSFSLLMTVGASCLSSPTRMSLSTLSFKQQSVSEMEDCEAQSRMAT